MLLKPVALKQGAGNRMYQKRDLERDRNRKKRQRFRERNKERETDSERRRQRGKRKNRDRDQDQGKHFQKGIPTKEKAGFRVKGPEFKSQFCYLVLK